MEMIIRMQILVFAMAAAGAVGAIGILVSSLLYKRTLKKRNESEFALQKDRWFTLWEKRDRAIRLMNRFVWYPSLASALLYGVSLLIHHFADIRTPLAASYLYMAVAVPVVLMLVRTGLDISFRETEALEWMREYIDKSVAPATAVVVSDVKTAESAKKERERKEKERREREKMLDHIAEGIRQTAATGGHFKKMLTPEETAIMKEIIQEFMNS